MPAGNPAGAAAPADGGEELLSELRLRLLCFLLRRSRLLLRDLRLLRLQEKQIIMHSWVHDAL